MFNALRPYFLYFRRADFDYRQPSISFAFTTLITDIDEYLLREGYA